MSKIATYKDLLEEKQQLEVLLKAQKELIRYDVEQLKGEIRPALRTFGVLGKMFTKDKTNALLGTGADTIIDIVFKRLILGRAGWVAKLVVPFLVKNVSSHVLAENKSTILHKVASLLRRKDRVPKGKMSPGPGPASDRKEASNGTVEPFS